MPKMYPNVTESILFLTKNNITFSRAFLKQQQNKCGLSSKEINEQLGVKSNGGGMWSIYTGRNICEQFPTKQLWEKLKSILKFDLEYEKVAQTFNTEMGITDVWDDISFIKEKRYHPTQKPQSLIKRLVQVSSNPGDRVLDPFAGSGTVGCICKITQRKYTGIEVNKTYFEMALNRIEHTQILEDW